MLRVAPLLHSQQQPLIRSSLYLKGLTLKREQSAPRNSAFPVSPVASWHHPGPTSLHHPASLHHSATLPHSATLHHPASLCISSFTTTALHHCMTLHYHDPASLSSYMSATRGTCRVHPTAALLDRIAVVDLGGLYCDKTLGDS